MTEAMKLETTDEALRNALAWYGEQARLARLIHSEGDKGRHALAEDGGKRAREVLALSASPAGVVKPLEWRDVRGDGSLYAGTDIGLAYIASEKAWGFRNYPDQYPVQGGIEAAKSAAFADYSARIMSAIEPAGVGVETRLREENENLRGALKPFARIADMEEKTPIMTSVMVNVDLCRNARASLKGDEQ